MAISRLHMSKVGFYELTPREFAEAMKDHMEVKRQEMELFAQTVWDSTRLNIFFAQLGNPNLKKRPKAVTDVMRFPWDGQKQSKPEQSVEDMISIVKAIHLANAHKRAAKRRRQNRAANTDLKPGEQRLGAGLDSISGKDEPLIKTK